MLQPGLPAPEIALNDLDSQAWELSGALTRGPVILAFFKVSCPTCQMTLPFLQRLAASASLIAISQDNACDTREFNRDFGIRLRSVIDPPPGYPASNAFRITNVPSIFVIETDGRISSAVHGFNKAELEKLGRRFGVPVFREDEQLPSLQPG